MHKFMTITRDATRAIASSQKLLARHAAHDVETTACATRTQDALARSRKLLIPSYAK